MYIQFSYFLKNVKPWRRTYSNMLRQFWVTLQKFPLLNRLNFSFLSCYLYLLKNLREKNMTIISQIYLILSYKMTGFLLIFFMLLCSNFTFHTIKLIHLMSLIFTTNLNILFIFVQTLSFAIKDILYKLLSVNFLGIPKIFCCCEIRT